MKKLNLKVDTLANQISQTNKKLNSSPHPDNDNLQDSDVKNNSKSITKKEDKLNNGRSKSEILNHKKESGQK